MFAHTTAQTSSRSRRSIHFRWLAADRPHTHTHPASKENTSSSINNLLCCVAALWLADLSPPAHLHISIRPAFSFLKPAAFRERRRMSQKRFFARAGRTKLTEAAGTRSWPTGHRLRESRRTSRNHEGVGSSWTAEAEGKATTAHRTTRTEIFATLRKMRAILVFWDSAKISKRKSQALWIRSACCARAERCPFFSKTLYQTTHTYSHNERRVMKSFFLFNPARAIMGKVGKII